MLRYGGLSGDEQEVSIRLDAQDGNVHVCSTWPAWSRKFEKRYGTPPKYQERDSFVTVAFWTLPIHVVSLRALVRKPGRTGPAVGRFTSSTRQNVAVSAPIRPKTYQVSSRVLCSPKRAV